jgi:predicted HAD superfamily Cof-like phosphohydrolase
MRAAQAKLREFHIAFAQLANDRPQMIPDAELKLRWELINEEAAEFQEAAEKRDLVGMADAIADIIYVTLGTAEALGLDAEPFFNEVHRSNMTKVWPDGTVRKSETGKVLKPDTYSPADIRAELNRQCANALGKKTAWGELPLDHFANSEKGDRERTADEKG